MEFQVLEREYSIYICFSEYSVFFATFCYIIWYFYIMFRKKNMVVMMSTVMCLIPRMLLLLAFIFSILTTFILKNKFNSIKDTVYPWKHFGEVQNSNFCVLFSLILKQALPPSGPGLAMFFLADWACPLVNRCFVKAVICSWKVLFRRSRSHDMIKSSRMKTKWTLKWQCFVSFCCHRQHSLLCLNPACTILLL